MQLSFDAANRLVELVEARHDPMPDPLTPPARPPLSASAPTAIARSLLDELVSGDARLQWRGASVGLADPPGAATALEAAAFVVFDLETTGLSPARLAHRRDRGAAGRGTPTPSRRIRDAREPGCAAACCHHGPHGHRPRTRTQRAPRAGSRRAPLPRVSEQHTEARQQRRIAMDCSATTRSVVPV